MKLSDCSNEHPLPPKHLGWLAGIFMHLFGRRPPEKTAAQLYRQDFSTSMQRLGVRFSDCLRNVFRRRWLRLK